MPALRGHLVHMGKNYYVYIITNKKEGAFYIGMTSNLPKRIWEHKNKIVEGFSQKYNLNKLVYYEVFDTPEEAIKREKRLKKWDREWKLQAIEEFNPEWSDLYETII